MKIPPVNKNYISNIYTVMNRQISNKRTELCPVLFIGLLRFLNIFKFDKVKENQLFSKLFITKICFWPSEKMFA